MAERLSLPLIVTAGSNVSEADRTLARLAILLQSERWRDRPPIFEMAPDYFLTVTIVTADQLRADLPQLFVEVIR